MQADGLSVAEQCKGRRSIWRAHLLRQERYTAATWITRTMRCLFRDVGDLRRDYDVCQGGEAQMPGWLRKNDLQVAGS